MTAANRGKPVHQTWSSQTVFLLATAGAAIGLGNLWRFPYLAGQNGGGAFVLIYIAFVLLIGVPIIMAELGMGRMGHLSPIGSIRSIIKKQGKSPWWQAIGVISLLVPFLGFTYYSVVAGWSIDYFAQGLAAGFANLTSEASAGVFKELAASPGRIILFQGLVIGLTVLVVGIGLRGGIERAAKALMPALFAILLVMIVYGIVEADFKTAFNFLFIPDFGALTARGVMEALGQAFFSVGVGVGFMMTYGAYLPRGVSVPKAATIIGGVDTLVALMAGMAIFPIVFAAGLNPAEGPGLVFVTMPVAFGDMPFGHGLGFLFFLLLFMAAFTSTIAMLEPIVSYLEETWQAKRLVLAAGAGAVVWLFGLLPALSFNLLDGLKPFNFIEGLSDKSVFESFDFFVGSILIPVNALLISLFVGWVIKTQLLKDELAFSSELMFRAWRLLIKFLAPLAVLAITVFGLIG